MRGHYHVDDVFEDVGAAVIEPQEWVVKNMIPAGLTFIIGPPKSLKSTVELALVLEVCGVRTNVLPDDLCEVPEEGLVMGLSAEATAGVLRHTAREGFGVEVPDDGRLRVCSDPWAFRLDLPKDMKELEEWVRGLKPRVLFIDPLRNLHSLDENDPSGMVALLQPLRQLAIKQHMAVIVVHHARKAPQDKADYRTGAGDMRGSSALLGLADAVLSLTGRAGSSTRVHISALFKRAEPWERTLDLGIWGEKKGERVSHQTAEIVQLAKGGMSQNAIATKLGISRRQVANALTAAERVVTDAGALPVDAVNLKAENVE